VFDFDLHVPAKKDWLGLQDDFDIEEEKQIKSKDLGSIKHYQSNTA